MVLQIIFISSGVVIALLLGAKVFELKKKRSLLFLRLISRGDKHLREISHELAHRYSQLKEDAMFFVEKQLPLHTKNIVNKSNLFLKEKVDKYVGDIRGSKLFPQKSEGISEFFQSLSEKENGRIDDTLEVPENTKE